MSKRHISTSIDGLLALSDKELTRMLDSVQDKKGNHPMLSEFKKYLNEEKAKGHRLLPSPLCDNFDPVHGCLGHPPGEPVDQYEFTDAIGWLYEEIRAIPENDEVIKSDALTQERSE